ncbi:RNA polymerase sigma factor [Actinomadura opuntiae]|uniref:RNA polymerase sigma factor n=1 Tax=Actinomadura sp. OS1-43 TaxID=604315 RepID=UPI00255B15BC|nr:RNA polymerase sigma factor [Actinomadura sp. OS1-43]MDL4816806.1 RNA polymerase sigma factor [Actinomadura sp. OS1-43]
MTGVRQRGADGGDDLDRALRAAQGGDEEAFRVLYRDVQPRLIRFAGALVGADAEDVTSEAWLQIARDLPGFRGDIDGFRGWTATITRHRALDHLRRRARRPAADAPAEELLTLAGPSDTEALALDGIATEDALRLIAGLPRDQAEAVLLRVVMGLDAKAAGKVLGKRPGAIRTAAHRGLRRLTERLAAPSEASEASEAAAAGSREAAADSAGAAAGTAPAPQAGTLPGAGSDKSGGTGAEGVR